MNVMNKTWSPYVAGALTGLLAIASVVITTQMIGKPKYLGTSTTMVRVSGLVEKQVSPEHVNNNEYFKSKKVLVEWQMMLVAGIMIGAFIASKISNQFKSELVPGIWSEKFGNKWQVRAIGAFLGGFIAILGARMAGGCPSGHGLSGMMQLAASSLLAMMGFMGGGFVVAHLIYKGGK